MGARHWPACAVAVALTVLLGLSYSGQWRVGRDSALYRAVGHELASDGRYAFRAVPEGLIHPGFPLMLAGIERAADEDDPFEPRLALAMMTATAALGLLAMYGLVRTRHGSGLALAVVALVGANPLFLAFAAELRPDMPLLLAVMVALLGAAGIRGRARDAAGVALIVIGLGVGVLLHPAGWFLAAALVVHAARERSAVLAFAAVAAAAAALALDPRSGAWFEGDYGRAVAAQLEHDPLTRLATHVSLLFEQGMPRAIADGRWPPLVGTIYSMMLIAGALRLAPPWRTYVAITLVATALVGVNPRYYLPLLPFLVLGWLLVASALAARVAPGARRLAVWSLAMAPLIVPEVVGAGYVVAQQRGWATAPNRELRPFVAMAPVLARDTTPSDVILAGEPRVLSYLADRRVYGLGEVARFGGTPTADDVRRFGFTAVVLPDRRGDESDLVSATGAAGLVLRPVEGRDGLVLYRVTSSAAR